MEMESNRNLSETPGAFLTNLGNYLSNKRGVDIELVEILKKYLLTENRQQDAVAQAMADIHKLSNERANTPVVENSDG
jgi:hypothetical protein